MGKCQKLPVDRASCFSILRILLNGGAWFWTCIRAGHCTPWAASKQAQTGDKQGARPTLSWLDRGRPMGSQNRARFDPNSGHTSAGQQGDIIFHQRDMKKGWYGIKAVPQIRFSASKQAQTGIKQGARPTLLWLDRGRPMGSQNRARFDPNSGRTSAGQQGDIIFHQRDMKKGWYDIKAVPQIRFSGLCMVCYRHSHSNLFINISIWPCQLQLWISPYKRRTAGRHHLPPFINAT